MLTVVGEIAESEVHTYQDRRTAPARPTASTPRSRTDGPSLRMSFFAKAKHVSDWHAGRLPVGRRGIFIGQVSTLPRPSGSSPTRRWRCSASTTPTRRSARRSPSIKALFPLYPQTKGVDSWDLQRAIAFALTVVDERARPAARPACATSTTCPT